MNAHDQDECRLRGIGNEDDPRKNCAKCNYSYLKDDLNDHDHCYKCAKAVFKETARECAISEVCEDCNGHSTMHLSGCDCDCEIFKDLVAEIVREWENE